MNAMMTLGSMCAEDRIAGFLIEMAGQMQQRGLSPSQLMLRMSREELGSYIGLKLETVSRALAAFGARHWITVHRKQIDIADHLALLQLSRSGFAGVKAVGQG